MILNEYGPAGLFFAFVIVHALGDFPLQGDYLARVKIRSQAANTKDWLIALTAHALIHGGGVWLVSGSAILGLVEVVLHWIIDLQKGEGRYGIATDQLLHVGSKLAYVLVLVYTGG
jgi:hypothetical protein